MAIVNVTLGLGGHLAVQAAQRLRWGRRILTWGLIVLLSAASSIAIGYGLAQQDLVSLPRLPWALHQWVWQIGYWLVPFALWFTWAQILEQGRAVRERDARLAAVEMAAREAEIRALHYQVNPHFLYNALNSLSALVLDHRTVEADRMILQLADFYRANLTVDPLKQVRLADEIAQQALYLEIEQTRFADRLRVEVACPPDLAEAEVPALILQPLVENAVKHGVNEPGRETRIRVAAERDREGRLRLEVSDNGPGGQRTGGAGVGLQNVRNRLQALYGDDAVLSTAQDANGFTATVVLPLPARI